MGSGKSTVAITLAKQLGWKVLDTDQMVIDHCNLDIPKIFDKYGERIFRGMEANVLRSTMHYENLVVATGGGAPCHNDNMEWMNEHGITIYLKLSSEELYKRLQQEKNERPLIASKESEQLVDFLRDHLNDRAPYYEEAAIKVNGSPESQEIVAFISSQLITQEKLAALPKS